MKYIHARCQENIEKLCPCKQTLQFKFCHYFMKCIDTLLHSEPACKIQQDPKTTVALKVKKTTTVQKTRTFLQNLSDYRKGRDTLLVCDWTEPDRTQVSSFSLMTAVGEKF